MNEKTAKLIHRVAGGDGPWKLRTMALWKSTPRSKRGALRKAIKKYDRRSW